MILVWRQLGSFLFLKVFRSFIFGTFCFPERLLLCIWLENIKQKVRKFQGDVDVQFVEKYKGKESPYVSET